MHHVILERWSRRESAVHARDARVKIVALGVFLVLVATTRNQSWRAYGGYGLLILGIILVSRLPLMAVLARAGIVLPFSVVFAVVSWLGGDPQRALALVVRGFLSASAVLVLVSTTRLPDLLSGLAWFRVPQLLILIAQFLYRYLFVLSEQAQHMRLAAACRGGQDGGSRRRGFRAAAGALGVLFARSYQRAEGIHQAMLARGFRGQYPRAASRMAGLADFAFLAVAVALPFGVRWVASL